MGSYRYCPILLLSVDPDNMAIEKLCFRFLIVIGNKLIIKEVMEGRSFSPSERLRLKGGVPSLTQLAAADWGTVLISEVFSPDIG